MPAPTHVPDSLAALAHSQCQVVTRRQALACGLSAGRVKGLVADGRWLRMTSGVFSVDGRAPNDVSWFQWAWAGLLITGSGSCLGLRAAAYLHGFDDPEYPIHVWVSPSHRTPRRSADPVLEPLLAFRSGDRLAGGSPPRTTVERTVIDLCSQSVPDGPEPFNRLRVMETIRTRIEEGVRYGHTTLKALRTELDGCQKLPGVGIIGTVLNLLEAQRQELNGIRPASGRPVPTDPWWPVTVEPPIRRWSPGGRP